ncbi:MAG: right-handed parallel beta-helix repeat-containing protein [Candidatus Thermoplasmatota archaeon]|nr:right-handed parallel beta-helix repeat-containing protein [Candidatus Thermoplasmatota archaeon]
MRTEAKDVKPFRMEKILVLGIFLLLMLIPRFPVSAIINPRDTMNFDTIQFTINNDGDGDPVDKKVDVPVYTPWSGTTPTLRIEFTITGTNNTSATAFYGDDAWEDWKNISITGDILYPVTESTLSHVGTNGEWQCLVTPIKPGGAIMLGIDWPGNGSATQTIQIINGTFVTPLVHSFSWGLDFLLKVSVLDIDGAPVKNAKVCLLWEEEDDEFNETEGFNKPGNGMNGEYWFWILREDQGSLPPKNITIAAKWVGDFWGYATVMMERPIAPPLVFVNDDYNGSTPGWGYNHFNTIQDGINAVAANGTVCVSNGTYGEDILVDKSLSLLGANKYSTIITGSGNGTGVNITEDNVTVQGFTIQNYTEGYGIIISSNANVITENIIADTIVGIGIMYGDPLAPSHSNNGYNTISGNQLIHNTLIGIGVYGRNNTLLQNSISESEYGIMVTLADSTNISQNNISENNNGVLNMASCNTTLYRNTFSQNRKVGLFEYCTSRAMVRQNNFIKNGRHAYFIQSLLPRIWLHTFFGIPISRSVWDENYWEKPQVLPHLIPGFISIVARGLILSSFYRVNFFQVDWHPAQAPYPSIEGT